MNDYYVYTHSDYNDNIFYIGKGTKNRASHKNGRSKEWFEKTKNGYLIDIPYTNLTEEEALDLEAILIETHGIDNLINIKKPSAKENRGTHYYDILQMAKDYKVLMEIYDNFDYYYKIPYFKKHIDLIHFIHQLQDDIKLLK